MTEILRASYDDNLSEYFILNIKVIGIGINQGQEVETNEMLTKIEKKHENIVKQNKWKYQVDTNADSKHMSLLVKPDKNLATSLQKIILTVERESLRQALLSVYPFTNNGGSRRHYQPPQELVKLPSPNSSEPDQRLVNEKMAFYCDWFKR